MSSGMSGTDHQNYIGFANIAEQVGTIKGGATKTNSLLNEVNYLKQLKRKVIRIMNSWLQVQTCYD